MKKVLFFLVLFISFFQASKATEQFIVKIGRNFTIYTVNDYGESNFWGRNVVITEKEEVLPNDDYFKSLGVPESEWKVFAENQNGIYDSRLEKSQKEKEVLRQDYNKLFAEQSIASDRIKILEILLVITFVALILFAIGFFQSKSRIRKCINLKNKINETHKDN